MATAHRVPHRVGVDGGLAVYLFPEIVSTLRVGIGVPGDFENVWHDTGFDKLVKVVSFLVVNNVHVIGVRVRFHKRYRFLDGRGSLEKGVLEHVLFQNLL